MPAHDAPRGPAARILCHPDETEAGWSADTVPVVRTRDVPLGTLVVVDAHGQVLMELRRRGNRWAMRHPDPEVARRWRER